jgi:hypothetical protein
MLQPWCLEIKFEIVEPHFFKTKKYSTKNCQTLVISYGIEQNYFMQENLIKHFQSLQSSSMIFFNLCNFTKNKNDNSFFKKWGDVWNF